MVFETVTVVQKERREALQDPSRNRIQEGSLLFYIEDYKLFAKEDFSIYEKARSCLGSGESKVCPAS